MNKQLNLWCAGVASLLLLANVCSMSAEEFTYFYDDAGRLTELRSSSGRSVRYVYDLNGNLLQEIVSANPDADGDGMEDAWEITTFGNASRNGTGDFDNDGQSDLAEFLAGTDPKNAASKLRIERLESPGGITATIYWAAVTGRKYRVQYKDALNDPWTFLSGDTTAAGAIASKTDSNLTAQNRRFYRVILVP